MAGNSLLCLTYHVLPPYRVLSLYRVLLGNGGEWCQILAHVNFSCVFQRVKF